MGSYLKDAGEQQRLSSRQRRSWRFNRLFLRILRALQDLRRYVPMVTVQHAEQVNIGGQPVNVAGASQG